MELPATDPRRAAIARFDFRGLHERLDVGTASDRYAGWLGQIYSPATWGHTVKSRKRSLGGRNFDEHQVPIASVMEYFEHFSVLELDFTFYRPLLEADGRPGSNYFVLQQYADAAPDHARFILKAPQAFSARILRQGKGYTANESFLDANGFATRFAGPAADLLEDRLRGVIFEQEYNRLSESPDPDRFASELGGFFESLPSGPQAHLEIRSPHLLTPPYFAMLRRCGLGFCFSHWTYLPSIKEQWESAGGEASTALTAQDGHVVLRLLTPRGVPYAEAYARSHPFNQAVPSISESPEGLRMVDEATALVFRALESGRTMNVIVNNRAWGNAPALAQAVTSRFLDVAGKRRL